MSTWLLLSLIALMAGNLYFLWECRCLRGKQIQGRFYPELTHVQLQDGHWYWMLNPGTRLMDIVCATRDTDGYLYIDGAHDEEDRKALYYGPIAPPQIPPGLQWDLTNGWSF